MSAGTGHAFVSVMATFDLVTKSENVLYADLANRRKTHCPQDHEYSLTNTYTDKKSMRHCRRCDADRHATRKEALRVSV